MCSPRFAIEIDHEYYFVPLFIAILYPLSFYALSIFIQYRFTFLLARFIDRIHSDTRNEKHARFNDLKMTNS